MELVKESDCETIRISKYDCTKLKKMENYTVTYCDLL